MTFSIPKELNKEFNDDGDKNQLEFINENTIKTTTHCSTSEDRTPYILHSEFGHPGDSNLTHMVIAGYQSEVAFHCPRARGGIHINKGC